MAYDVINTCSLYQFADTGENDTNDKTFIVAMFYIHEWNVIDTAGDVVNCNCAPHAGSIVHRMCNAYNTLWNKHFFFIQPWSAQVWICA